MSKKDADHLCGSGLQYRTKFAGVNIIFCFPQTGVGVGLGVGVVAVSLVFVVALGLIKFLATKSTKKKGD